MAVDADADRRVALDDPDRALVELAARDGPLCASCLAGRIDHERVDVLKRLALLTSRGHLRQTDGGRYDVTDDAHARLRGVDAGP